MRGALEEPVPPLARSSHRFRAEQYSDSVPKFEKPHHILCGGLIFLEMSRLKVRSVRVDVRIHLEDEDVSRILLVGHRIQRQHSRLQPDGRFDLLLHRGLVGPELRRIDLDFGHAHIWLLRILAHCRTTRECRQHRGAKNQNLLCIHVTLLQRSVTHDDSDRRRFPVTACHWIETTAAEESLISGRALPLSEGVRPRATVENSREIFQRRDGPSPSEWPPNSPSRSAIQAAAVPPRLLRDRKSTRRIAGCRYRLRSERERRRPAPRRQETASSRSPARKCRDAPILGPYECRSGRRKPDLYS